MSPGVGQSEYMGMDDYGDEDEVGSCCSADLLLPDKEVLLDNTLYFFAMHFVPGVAGVDGQNQRETGEEHQAAGSGGKTRKCSR